MGKAVGNKPVLREYIILAVHFPTSAQLTTQRMNRNNAYHPQFWSAESETIQNLQESENGSGMNICG